MKNTKPIGRETLQDIVIAASCKATHLYPEPISTMKLYYFNPNDYGYQYFVCAESREQAQQSLRDYRDDRLDSISKWLPAERMRAANLENGYTLDEFRAGEVLCSEIS